jgi:PKD repeat protein
MGLAALAALTAGLLLGASAVSLRVQAAPGDTTRVYVDPAVSSVSTGETLVLSIGIEGAEDLIAYEFELSWDPAVFSYVEGADGGFLQGGLLGSFRLVSPGTVNAQMTTLPPNWVAVSGDGVLATVTLLATGGGTSTLEFDNVTMLSVVNGSAVPWVPDVVNDGWAEVACDPVSLFNVEATTPVEVGRPMDFLAEATGSEPISYTWDFGGPGTASGEGTATPSYLYDAAGRYTATVTATNPCHVDHGSIMVEVTCDTAEIDGLISDSPVELGETIHFTASLSGAEPITTTWDFDGDGSPERVGTGLDVVTYTYPAAGAYSATLTVDNLCGVEDRDELPVLVLGSGDLVRIEDLTYEGLAVAGQPLTFTASVTGSEPITYSWDFDSDGAPEQVGTALSTVTYTYATGGGYTVTLGAENAWGADSRELALDVCEPVSLVALTSDGSVRVGHTTHFTATLTGTEPITYTWDVDSDGAPEVVGPGLDTFAHLYAAAGTYTATLTVENACGEDVDTAVARVEPYMVFLPLVLR